MTSPWYENDEQLLEELALARQADAPPPEATEMIMVGYDLVMADTLEAALIHDSDAGLVGAVRSETAGARMLSFALEDFEIEFELVGGRIVGHVDPPQDGTMVLEQPTITGPATDEIAPDELGSFEFPLRQPATFRLRFIDGSGRSVATGWIDGPHETLD